MTFITGCEFSQDRKGGSEVKGEEQEEHSGGEGREEGGGTGQGGDGEKTPQERRQRGGTGRRA